MGEPQIDRAAWAAIILGLVDTRSKGKIAPFARLVGADPRTISRWLRAEVDVDEFSVRKIARVLDLPVVPLLIRVGYYRNEELTDPVPLISRDDPVVQEILSQKFPEEVKMEMLRHLEEIRAEERETEMRDVRRWIDWYKRNGNNGTG